MAFKGKKAPVREKDSGDSEIIHRFKTHPGIFIGTIIVLILVIVSFVLVPAIVPEYSRGGSADLTFGSYDRIPITYVPGNYFSRYYSMVSQYYQSSMDPNNFQFATYQIWRQAFEGAAIHTAILQEIKKAHYTIPTEIVDREVAGLSQFQENGRFSPVLYERLSSSEQLTLWRQIQEDLTKERFYSDVTGLLTAQAEGAFIGKMAGPQRSFEMTFFSVDSYPDSEIEKYAAEHPDLFRSTHLSKITINSSERDARKVRDSIKNESTTFEDAARTYSQDSYADKGGDMGIKPAYELIREIPGEAERETIISLGREDLSDVIKLDSGWAFFRAEDTARQADSTDQASLERVRSYVREFERGRMEDWTIAQARDFIVLANISGFDEAQKQQGVEKRVFGPLPINYGSIDLYPSLISFSVAELGAAANDENFWKTAFTTPVNTFSEPVVEGGFVLVLRPTEEIPAEESSVESIGSTYSNYWLSYMSQQSLGNYFLNSEKLEDKFLETYFRYFLPQSE